MPTRRWEKITCPQCQGAGTTTKGAVIKRKTAKICDWCQGKGHIFVNSEDEIWDHPRGYRYDKQHGLWEHYKDKRNEK